MPAQQLSGNALPRDLALMHRDRYPVAPGHGVGRGAGPADTILHSPGSTFRPDHSVGHSPGPATALLVTKATPESPWGGEGYCPICDIVSQLEE